MKTIVLLLLISAVYFAAAVPDRSSIGRIVNGLEAAEGQFPFIASFRIWGNPFCGASIITTNFLITAGHCCNRTTAEASTVLVGTNSLAGGGVRYQVQNIHLHPEYYHPDGDLVNDICLLELDSEIELSNLIQPINLNEGLDDSPQDAIVAGWGDTLQTLPTYNLQYLPTRLVPYQQCVDLWSQHTSYTIRESQVCAFTVYGEGTCDGDSGGPLTTLDETGNPILTGLVSWGYSCARGYPDVYTKVGSYIEWINSVINSRN